MSGRCLDLTNRRLDSRSVRRPPDIVLMAGMIGGTERPEDFEIKMRLGPVKSEKGPAPPVRSILAVLLGLWATATTIGCALALGWFIANPSKAPWASPAPLDRFYHPQDVPMGTLLVNASTPRFQRYNSPHANPSSRRHLESVQSSAAAAGVTKMLGEDGSVLYEIHHEITADLPWAEYAQMDGFVSKHSFRMRIKQMSTGDQATLTPFGLSAKSIVTKNASLLPTFFHFAHKASGRRHHVSAFVRASAGRYNFHQHEGEQEWGQFMDPFLTQYWKTFVDEYGLTPTLADGSRRALGQLRQAVGAMADDAIQWGEGKVSDWAGDEGGELGRSIGADVGEKLGGYVGEAAGSAVGGPAGAVVGREIGAHVGDELGGYLGNEAGSAYSAAAAEGGTRGARHPRPLPRADGPPNAINPPFVCCAADWAAMLARLSRRALVTTWRTTSTAGRTSDGVLAPNGGKRLREGDAQVVQGVHPTRHPPMLRCRRRSSAAASRDKCRPPGA